MRHEEFECVDPGLKARIDALVATGENPLEHEDLALHLEICHACREERRLADAAAALIAEGAAASLADRMRRRLRIAPPRGRGIAPGEALQASRASGSRRLLWTLGGAAAAAALVLALALPPAPRDALGLGGRAVLPRGGGAGVNIDRPVEGEVLLLTGGKLAWDSIERARAYRITLESQDGRFSWSGVVETNAFPLPAESEIEGSFTARVEPLPTDLVPEREGSVFFHRAGWRQFLGYRFTHLPWLSAALGVGALGLMAVAILRRH